MLLTRSLLVTLSILLRQFLSTGCKLFQTYRLAANVPYCRQESPHFCFLSSSVSYTCIIFCRYLDFYLGLFCYLIYVLKQAYVPSEQNFCILFENSFSIFTPFAFSALPMQKFKSIQLAKAISLQLYVLICNHNFHICPHSFRGLFCVAQFYQNFYFTHLGLIMFMQ